MHVPGLQQQSPVTNGVFKMEMAEETAMAAPVMLHATPPKSKGGGGRKNRRKADLSQEASPHDDDDEFILSTTGDSPSPGTVISISHFLFDPSGKCPSLF
jgi:hypothetical protein